MKSDNLISREYKAKDIELIAKKFDIPLEELFLYGKHMAKVNYSYKGNKNGRLVLVTSTSPNKKGIGKTTLSIGLNDALNKSNKKSIVCLREPSLGPVFGMKGGACGGGYSQIYPIEKINLHFTGDLHAITTVNNLIAAVLDNLLYQENPLNIDKDTICFKRVIDINDRTLRDITIAQKKKTNGITREDSFQITVASEIMAILALCDSLEDFVNKVEDIVIAYTYDKKEIRIKDLNMSGSIAVLMEQAINPNIVQTLEGNLAFVHAGPFANIAHGTNSILATKMALSLSDYTVVEAGFGSDLGAEKFLNLVAPRQNLKVDHIVLVTSIASLKEYSNNDDLISGIENNLKRHIKHLKQYNIDLVVTINKHLEDSQRDIDTLLLWCDKNNINCVVNEVFKKGSKGGLDLANLIINSNTTNNKTIYQKKDEIEEKIKKVITNVYGAKNYELSEIAQEKIDKIKDSTYSDFPICFAKTPMSFSDDSSNKELKEEFVIKITDIKIQTGAKFIVLYANNVLTLPGLSNNANVHKIKYDYKNKEVEGLS